MQLFLYKNANFIEIMHYVTIPILATFHPFH